MTDNKMKKEVIQCLFPNVIVYHISEMRSLHVIMDVQKSQKSGASQTLIVFDADYYSYQFFKKPIIRDIFMNGRNHGITSITAFSASCLPYIQTDVCSQVHILFTQQQFGRNDKRIWKKFYPILDEYNDYKHYQQLSRLHFLVCDNMRPSSKIEDVLSYFCPPRRMLVYDEPKILMEQSKEIENEDTDSGFVSWDNDDDDE
jgi:hypothetical protein